MAELGRDYAGRSDVLAASPAPRRSTALAVWLGLAALVGISLWVLVEPPSPDRFAAFLLPMLLISALLLPPSLAWALGRGDTFSLTAWSLLILWAGHTLLPLAQIQLD